MLLSLQWSRGPPCVGAERKNIEMDYVPGVLVQEPPVPWDRFKETNSRHFGRSVPAHHGHQRPDSQGPSALSFTLSEPWSLQSYSSDTGHRFWVCVQRPTLQRQGTNFCDCSKLDPPVALCCSLARRNLYSGAVDISIHGWKSVKYILGKEISLS